MSSSPKPEGDVVMLPFPLPASELLARTFAPVEFAIEPYFPSKEVIELVGAHAIYKSTAALGACASVASGRAWGGAPARRGLATFITLEDTERTLQGRLLAWLEGVPAGRERDEARSHLEANLFYLAREHARDLALTATDRNATYQRESVVKHLGAWLNGAALVVLETASRLHGGPELNEGLAVFASAVEQVAIRSGAAVCVVRHVSKAAASEGRTDSYAGRGGGAFSDAARSVLTMTREGRTGDGEEVDGDGTFNVTLTHSKSTLVRPGASITWRPISTPFGAYLYSLSRREEARAEEQKVVAYLRAVGTEGVTHKALHTRPPQGLSRRAALLALDRLVGDGRVTRTEEPRGRTNQPANVYRLAEVGHG